MKEEKLGKIALVISIFALSIAIAANCNAQYCTPPTSMVLSVHGSFRSAGVELGTWTGPEDGRLSWFVGATFLWNQGKEGTARSDIFYVKPMYLLFGYPSKLELYAVTSVGIRDFERLYLEGGIRAVIGLSDRIAFGYEPVYSLQSGVNHRALLSISLN